jgi:hydroxyacylglutathione hydrolase
MDIHILAILNDNYAFIIQSGDQVGVIDPGEAKPFIEFLDTHNLQLDWIINTHHHADHINGNEELINRFGCKLAAPSECGQADMILSESDAFAFGDVEFQIIETPGHTMGHVCLYSERDKTLFSGDTVFAGGCGRLFEGTAKDMFYSFQKLHDLPHDTVIYFGHEYTKSNLEFAAHIFSDNNDVQTRLVDLPNVTIPTNMHLELKTNPFFLAETVEEFFEYRMAKNQF